MAISSRDLLEVGAGAALGYAAANVIANVGEKRRQEAEKAKARAKIVEESILKPETYKGIPVDPIMAEILRERDEDLYLKKHGPPKKTYTAEDVKKVFDPPATAYERPLGKLSAELSAKIDAVKNAPDLETALKMLGQIPALYQVAKGREAIVFELHLERVDPDTIPNNWQKTYATSVQLVARRGVLRNHLRLQAVQHDAIRQSNVLSRNPDIMAFNQPLRSGLMDLFAREPVSSSMVDQETRGKLSPAVLAEAAKRLLETGLPSRVDTKY